MFRFFVVLFEILVLVMILRTSFVQFWISDMQEELTDWMYDLSLTLEKQQLNQFKEEIAPHTQNLKDYQKEYLDQVMGNKKAVRAFYIDYCEGNDKNPYIYGASLHYVCSEIARSELLKEF